MSIRSLVAVSAAAGWCLTAVTGCHAGNLSITLALPDGRQETIGKSAVKQANLEFFELDKLVPGSVAKPVARFSGSIDGPVQAELASGRYIVVSKSWGLEGTLDKEFSASFLVGSAYVEVGQDELELKVPVALFEMRGCQIQPTDVFQAGYLSREKDLLPKDFEFPGITSGRVIKLSGTAASSCSLTLYFPKEVRGSRGLHTYTPTSFELHRNDTLSVDTFIYNGKVDNLHDVYKSGARLDANGGNAIIIRNVAEKTGVNIPWEPRMTLATGGCVVNSTARVNFRSDESSKPAQIGISYVYLDDPFIRYSPTDLLVDQCPGPIAQMAKQ